MNDLSTLAGQAAHYAAVRARLFNAGAPAERPSERRVIRVRRNSHRPDVEIFPTVRVTEETRQRVRDILLVARSERVDAGLPADPEIWTDIVAEVLAKHGVTRAELMSAQRGVHIVACRHEVFYRMSKETTLSLPQIGKRIGGKDHTTVLHGIRRHAAKIGAKR